MSKILFFGFLALMSMNLVVHAKEGGDQSANGAESWMVGALPPPGNYFVNYFGGYSGSLRGHNGQKVKVAGRDVDGDVVFDAARYLRMTNIKILGANFGWGGAVPLVDLSINFAGRKDGRAGLGDVAVTPFILAWHSEEMHQGVGLDIFLPTGTYNKNNPPGKNLGANYISFEPIYAVTYLSRTGWEASAKLMYNIKQNNRDTDYRSGDEFHVDFLFGRHVGFWSYGLAGYYLKQVTDDRKNGVKVGADGHRGEVFAFGPSIKYQTASHLNFVFQWQHETVVENRFKGDKIWAKLIAPF